MTKKGGWLHIVHRSVPFRCPSTAIPPLFELDMKGMEPHAVVRMRDLVPPAGCVLAAPDGGQPVVRATLKVGAD